LFNFCFTFKLLEIGNGSFLARLSGILVSIATDPVKFPNVALQTTASSALSKFMLVSEKFARTHLRLFFTILEMTSEPTIKINSIIACGDLCIRFPNLLDPWTPKLYSALRSKSIEVRATTFKVVSRLILSDMIKIKEQISEVAKMIVDDDLSLAQMASYFFKELAKKNNNAIYNILPDVISNLSNAEVGISPEHFQVIVGQLIELIEKDKQTICLVEKLCQRFKLVDREREYNDLSFCLTQMQLSERSLGRICENLPCFADKLVFDQVYQNFLTVIANGKKLTGLKNDMKQMLDDFAKKVEDIRQKGLEDPNAMQVDEDGSTTVDGVANSSGGNTSTSRTPMLRKTQSTRKKTTESKRPVSTRKATGKRTSTRTKKRLTFDDPQSGDEDRDETGVDAANDSDHDEQPEVARKTNERATRASRRTRVTRIQEESEDD
jgi:condensin complex subunit 1